MATRTTALSNIRDTATGHPFVSTMAGLVCFVGCLIGLYAWVYISATAPVYQPYTPWITQNAQVVRFTENPTITTTRVPVSLGELKKHAENEPYLVTSWAGWNIGSSPADKESEHHFTVHYLVKKPGTDIYLYATETIPHGCWGFVCSTVFNGKSFSVEIRDRDYAEFNALRTTAAVLLLFGAIAFAICYWKRNADWDLGG